MNAMISGWGEQEAERWRPRLISTWIAYGAAALWAASLVTPALVISTSSKQAIWNGAMVLLAGWFAILGGYIAWLANIAFFWALLWLAKRESAIVVSWLALL